MPRQRDNSPSACRIGKRHRHDPNILDAGVGERFRLRRVAVENALTLVLEFPDRNRVELQHDVPDSHVPASPDDVSSIDPCGV